MSDQPTRPVTRPGKPGSGTPVVHAAPGARRDRSDADRQRHFIFLLLNQFTHLPFAAALEPLRIANRMSGLPLYRWTVIAEDSIVASADGTRLMVDAGLIEVARDDVVILCSGLEVRKHTTPALLNWLRRAARKGSVIGGVCTGTYALARAGLLNGRRATIHWESRDGFAEDFPDVVLTKSVFAIEGNRMSAAGGTAALDMMLTLIADDHGRDLANGVADQMIHTGLRTQADTQRLSIPTRIGVRHPRLAEVIAQMEAQIEEPASPADLAAAVGMSTRQLERLFRRYLNRSPKRYYMELRLARARNLLMQTDMSVIEVALACGFTSPSHFSKCYRAQYGTTPYRERGAQGIGNEEGAEPGLPEGPDEDDGLV